VLGPSSVQEREHLSLLLEHLIEALLHVALVLGMKEIVADLAQELSGRVTQYVQYPLIHKRELAIHGMTCDKLALIIRATHVVGRRGGDLQSTDGHQAAVRAHVVHVALHVHIWEHIGGRPVLDVARAVNHSVVGAIPRGSQ